MAKITQSVFSVEKAEESLGLLLWQTTITWQRFIKKALDKHNISHAQFVILAIVLWFETHNENPTQIVIAKQSKLDKMTVSKSLKKLALDGYIKRAEHADDTRAKSVRLTAKGKAIASKLVPIVENVDRAFFDILETTHQKSLTTILSVLSEVLEC
ncbi:MAG TPA: winged helix DNA-binding protein [Gammaproteobacteria bacterium]|nr:winged helix DNA-binding protein [Gammaproteobacteria bacterium]